MRNTERSLFVAKVERRERSVRRAPLEFVSRLSFVKHHDLFAVLDFNGQLDKSRYRVRSEAYGKAEVVPGVIATQFEGLGV